MPENIVAPGVNWPPSNDSDPYLALEALDDPAVDAWVDAQCARTIEAFGRGARVDALSRRLLEAYTSEEQLIVCSRWNDWAYNTWIDAAHPLGFVRRTPWDVWLAGTAQWETVLDIGAIDLNCRNDDSTRWTLQDFQILYPDADRALVLLSPGGADACVVKEFDINARAFVEDGFNLPVAGVHTISWIDRNTVYVAWDNSAVNGEVNLTASKYPQQTRKWTRGSAVDAAPVVFACDVNDQGTCVFYDCLAKVHNAVRMKSFFEFEKFWLDETSGAWRQYDLPMDAALTLWNGWLMVSLRTAWDIEGSAYPADSLLAIDRHAFLGGARDFTTLFAPADRQVLADAVYTRHMISVVFSDNGKTRVVQWRAPIGPGLPWQQRELALPAESEVSISAVHCEVDDTVLIHVCHFLTPPTLFYADLGTDEPWRRVSQLPAQFDATGFAAQRHHAIAADGEPIPYWVIGRASGQGDTPRPCMLSGYGGFAVSMDAPSYVDTEGFAWLERGGVLAIACTRGGGEFGTAWHEAARRENRQVAFDDFMTIAQALIDTGVTTPQQLGIVGGSNGGLLTAACMMQRPDLFGAVVSEVPLLDMSRFHLLLQGALWIDEYGNPDEPDDLRFLLRYSPYHRVQPDVAYPPVLFVTSSTDDRVHPGHARKMTARMQGLGHQRVWLFEREDGGHGAGVLPEAVATTQAMIREFLWSTLAEGKHHGGR
ncbi:prolyl oligopeptidase family serine peptidase [Paraburkholderia edwinii]|uniref:Prolyl oligopeptidase family serine peptidase n=1 Tax=Paraburkholderia edwinii TaxID=2861782 RepID=A0ABX8UPY4_9BURK|nr:prolyl oligopeptidase family serine peptidase [Paraburkholderia edwinii]QYD70681.1 prolyl oligopeptidase family serine peptidase [Paraburkholderia edwinii]